MQIDFFEDYPVNLSDIGWDKVMPRDSFLILLCKSPGNLDTSKLRRKLSLLSAYKLSSVFQICLFFVEGLTAFLFSSVIIDFAGNQFKSKISVPF